MNLEDSKIRSIARKLAINPILPTIQKSRDYSMTKFSAITQYPKEAILLSLKLDKGKGSRSAGCFLGLAIGNSSCLNWEGVDIDESTSEIKDPINRNYLEGQYSDDTAMALCLAESLLVKCNFEATDAKLRWFHWWTSGYCNGLIDKMSSTIGNTVNKALNDMLTNKKNIESMSNLVCCTSFNLFKMSSNINSVALVFITLDSALSIIVFSTYIDIDLDL